MAVAVKAYVEKLFDVSTAIFHSRTAPWAPLFNTMIDEVGLGHSSGVLWAVEPVLSIF